MIDTEEESKKMLLGQDVKAILNNFKKYDKSLFSTELDKDLMVAVDAEMKRIEKAKKTSKILQGEVYDNELTIPVISNLMRGVSDLSKEARDIPSLREDKKQLQKQVSDLN